jgi:hypothetical protein
MHVRISTEKIEQSGEGNQINLEEIYMSTIKILFFIGEQMTLIQRKSGENDKIYKHREDFSEDVDMQLT